MKGMVFTEYMDMVEVLFGEDTLEDMLDACDLESNGAYTAVGTYPHSEMVQLVGALSELTEIAVPDLLKAYGKHLFGRFVTGYPAFFADVNDTFDFLKTLQNHIHVEVRKLYPEAELPTFTSTHSGNEMVMEYSSERPFADFAEGLLGGCIEYFDQPITMERVDLADTGKAARFTLTHAA